MDWFLYHNGLRHERLKVFAVTRGISRTLSNTYTLKNTVISPSFLVWKFCGKAQFPHSFERITENLPFHKISKPGNW